MTLAANPTDEGLRTGYVRVGGWQMITPGVHLAAGPAPDLLAELAGWQLVCPAGAGFTGITAAQLRGWWLPPMPTPIPVFIGMDNAGARPRRRGLIVHRQCPPFTHDVVCGLRVASAPGVLLSAARDLGLLDLVVLADAALHRGGCTRSELSAAAATRCHGAPALRRALRYVDGGAESAWETVLRMLLVCCGVPVEVQYEVRDDDGRFVARGDLRIKGTKRLMEYDGGGHREPRQHAKDLDRDRRLLRVGWQRFGYTSAVVLHSARAVLLDADEVLGRPHRPERIQAWHRLLAESAFTPAGRARLAARWKLALGGRGFRSLPAATGAVGLPQLTGK